MPTLPDYAFSQHTLDNGLRVVISEDHLAPVVAVNVWYDVGSRRDYGSEWSVGRKCDGHADERGYRSYADDAKR